MKCYHCHEAEAVPGRVLCDGCATKQASRDSTRYARLKAQGLCVRCGKRPAAEGGAQCSHCRAADLKRHRQRSARRERARASRRSRIIAEAQSVAEAASTASGVRVQSQRIAEAVEQFREADRAAASSEHAETLHDEALRLLR